MSRARRLLHPFDPLLQIALVISLAQAYRILRTLIPTDWAQATANARQIVSIEQMMHLGWERSLQESFMRFPELIKAMNWFYLASHFFVTGAFFVWLYLRNRDGFSIFRDGFLLGTAIALVIHWRYPTAPPRLAGLGIKDTIELYSGVNVGEPHRERFSNPVAAVPSLHAGWAVALGVGLRLYARNVLLRIAGVLYPAAVLLTIIVTGNHFVFDAIVGVLVMAIGFALTVRLRLGGREPAYGEPCP